MTVRVAWLFSSIRSGSSIAAYSAAAPWGHAVADEVFGPWVRTREPYNYPPVQRRLVNLVRTAGKKLTPDAAAAARRLFNRLGEPTGAVIHKHPHRWLPPEEVAHWFPEHRSVFLLRNPLHRLNSLYARGWTKALTSIHDLDTYKEVARRWLAHPHRVIYDDMKRDPAKFYSAVWTAWDWQFTPADIAAAAAYRQSHYHKSSGVENAAHDAAESSPDRVLSESRQALPREAVTAYLSDSFILDLMHRCGWETTEDAYLEPEHVRRERGVLAEGAEKN